jgi:hypothetical protein
MRRLSVPVAGVLSALLAIALLGPGLGPASGAIPQGGTYSACLTKATGETDIINYPKVKCGKGERLIRWSSRDRRVPRDRVVPRDPQDPPTGTPSPTSPPASPMVWTTRGSRGYGSRG